MNAKTWGYSHQDRAIDSYSFGAGQVNVLLLAGVHGDECEGFGVAERFLELLVNKTYSLPTALRLMVLPRLNPDGCAALSRSNAKNVDLNRNLPTQNWSAIIDNPRYQPGMAPGSEPENEALIQLIESFQPSLILSLHSYSRPMVNYDGAFSQEVAEVMARANGLTARGDIGYPTTGSLGTYAALERQIPTVTLEILKGQNLETAWSEQRPALIAALEWASQHLKN